MRRFTKKSYTANQQAGITFAILAGLLLAFVGWRVLVTYGFLNEVGESETAQTQNVVHVDSDYAIATGKAEVTHADAPVGKVAYCPLDKYERAACAYGYLTRSLFLREKEEKREPINVNPSGWQKNFQTFIPPLKDVAYSKGYKGWFWNRSHLVADSLGGEAIKENLVTGTRTQNVGSTQTNGEYSGGMAYTERIARDYLASQKNDRCPLYYAATPQYDKNNPIPTTVIVDMRNCNGDIDMRVTVSNTANGFDINYQTGKVTKQK